MEQYHQRVAEVTKKASHMKDVLVNPVLDDSGIGFIKDKSVRVQRLTQATKNSIFEGIGEYAPAAVATASNAIQSYSRQHFGAMPPDELLASAYNAIEHGISLTADKEPKNINGMVLEAAEMSTTQGILMRDRMIALILPVMLNSVVSNIASFIPGQYNQSEIFRIWRKAGSTFGDLTKGDRIDFNYTGQYSSMDQRFLAGTGDGTKTGSADDFKLSSLVKFGVVQPFKRKSIKIMHDHNIVAKDDGLGNLSGVFPAGTTSVTVTGAVDYDNGIVNPVFSVAPATGIQIHIGLDIDIEKNPGLIPLVTTEMDSRVLYPHESAIAANTTLQALWTLRREYNLNADGLAMTAMRNLLSADKDRKALRDLYFFAQGTVNWAGYTTLYNDIGFYYKSLMEALLTVDKTLMLQNGYSGLVGIVADSSSAAVFKGLKTERNDALVTPPGYYTQPQPHYVGKLFGMWDLYEDPNQTAWTCLCFAKGQGLGEAGYVMGDAIPAMAFRHAIQRDLTYKNTLWELAYRDLQPFDGRKYFMTMTISH